MSISIIEKNVMSSDGKHELKGVMYLPEVSPKGLFHVVHGMIEHIGRYDGFMREMAQNGYVVFGYDHLGHGKTGAVNNDFGFISKKDGWVRLVDDVSVFGNTVKESYKGLPYYLMGHSMGSFIVRLAAAKYPDLYDKLIIMGTGGPNPATGAGIAITSIAKTFKGEKNPLPLIDKTAFGSYNSHFAEENDPKSWLTKDISVRDKNRADPYCNFDFSVSAMGDLLRLTKNCNSTKWYKEISKDKPILLVSGKDDPVGDYSKGVCAVYDRLQASGADVHMKIYENCRHEILNDTCRDEVISDIMKFIE